MDSKKVLYSKGKNDECYTPAYGVQPILEFVPVGKTVWCPFDTKESWFVKLISEQNKVVHSHIDDGKDFFLYEPKVWDVIISNPPFTNKRLFFERAINFNKPFALLMTNTWLNDAAPKRLFMDKELQLLMFDKRIEFDNRSKITFSSSYFCWRFLPKQIVIKFLDKGNQLSLQF
ncbi:MAG: tRNA (adenine-N(6)-)-methyltransferase [Aequorivita sp.]